MSQQPDALGAQVERLRGVRQYVDEVHLTRAQRKDVVRMLDEIADVIEQYAGGVR